MISSIMSQLPHIVLFAALLPALLHAQTGGNLSNCKGGCESGERCIGNPFSQPVSDSECNTCAGGRYWWPCNFETLCYCNRVEEGSPRVPPAPKSRIKLNDSLDPCKDILTEEIFNAIVQPTNDLAKNLYTYDGLCSAIMQYNTYHDEKFANMGSEEQMRAEMAAFLAHAAVDTYGFSIVREEHHCVDPIVGSDGKTYCKPCKEEHYNFQTKTCSQDYFTDEEGYKEYCDSTRQGTQGCVCNTTSVVPATNVPGAVDIDTSGYIAASDAYFTRGAIQTSWNYDYLGASLSMTGDENLLCDNPDLVATNPQMAWGVGIYKWMEKMIFGSTGTTAHKQVLKGNFGGTLEVLYGNLECPANKWASAIHLDMVTDRVAQICKSGVALGVYLEMDKCDTPSDCLECEGLKEIFESCQENGSCPECSVWPQFLRSVAPTVTPIRIESPSWDDWAGKDYGESASSGVGTQFSVYLVLFSAGSLFAAI